MEDIIKYVNEWNLKSSEDGLNKLLEDTKNEEKITIAKNMLNRKLSIEDISSFTGLTKEEILSLK